MTETPNDTETFTVELTGDGGEAKKEIPWKQILIALGIAATLLRSG